MRELDPNAHTFGLPRSMCIPIAAQSLDAIEQYVGPILSIRTTANKIAGAILVDSSERTLHDDARIWSHPRVHEFERRLFPVRQVWAHVDYGGYRRAYKGFGMPVLEPGEVLDHIQNRRAIRLRDYSHPYIRLCPVSHRVNTNSGVNAGAEGMERAHMESAKAGNAAALTAIHRAKQQAVVYADPLDLTKMLNIVPGTGTLDGVRDVLRLYYT